MNADLFLFEDAESSRFVELLYPELSGRCLSFETFLFRFVTDRRLTPQARKEKAASFLPHIPPSEVPAWLHTVETLREALLVTPEDIDFAFSELAPTPKNTQLKTFFRKYLDSDLSMDWITHVMELLEMLKIPKETPWELPGITFVRSIDSRFFFWEVARGYGIAQGKKERLDKESWETFAELGAVVPATSRKRATLCLEGSPARCVTRLVTHLRRILDRGTPPHHILLQLHAEPAVQELFGCSLDHYKIPSQSFLAGAHQSTRTEENPIHRLLLSLRRDKRIPLRDRLRLGALLSSDSLGRKRDTPWPDYFARLHTLSRITAEEETYLKSLMDLGPSEKGSETALLQKSPMQKSGVWLLPFLPLSGHAKYTSFGYIDRSYLAPERHELILRPNEMEILHRAGFPVARTRELKQRRLTALNAFMAKGDERRFLFTPLDREQGLGSDLGSREGRGSFKRYRIQIPNDSGLAADNDSEETLVLPDRSLSATQLETYTRCPAQYFFSSRLRLRRQAPEEQYSLIFGQLTHSALEHFFKAQPKPDPSQITEGLMAEFSKALERELPTLEKTHPFHEILTQHFRRIIHKVPELEAQLRSICGAHLPHKFELDFSIEVEGLKLRGKIDRIDITSGDRILILDYKTGTVDFSPGHISQGEHYQALLYLLASEVYFNEPCAGILFYDLKKGELRRGILIEGRVEKEAKKLITRGHLMTSQAYSDLKAQGISRLKKIAADIQMGSYVPKPSPQNCAHCDYSSLCRKGFGYV